MLGDTDGDSDIDLDDLNNVRNFFGGGAEGDADHDGDTDLDDLNAVRNNFGAVAAAEPIVTRPLSPRTSTPLATERLAKLSTARASDALFALWGEEESLPWRKRAKR
jgi:hypothetical protein